MSSPYAKKIVECIREFLDMFEPSSEPVNQKEAQCASPSKTDRLSTIVSTNYENNIFLKLTMN